MPKHRVPVYRGRRMSALNSIPPAKLFRLVGIPQAPVIIDVQTDEDFALNPRLIPGSLRRSHENVADWSPEFRGRSAVVVCQKGLKLSQGVAGWLRHEGVAAETLEGGALAWADAGLPMVPCAKLPASDHRGRTGCAAAPCRHRAGRGYRPTRAGSRGGRAACGVARPVPDVRRRPRATGGRHAGL